MKRSMLPRSSFALACLPAAALVVLAFTGGFVDARQTHSVAAPALQSEETSRDGMEIENDPALAWVDPVITGPVSPQYKRQREAAGCDQAVWPHIPAVCFPDGIAER